MQKAMRRKAELNLNYTSIIIPSKSKSFLSFSTPMISSKLSSVGVKIGSNEREISIFSNALRQIEVDHLTIIPKVLAFSHTTYVDDEEVRRVKGLRNIQKFLHLLLFPDE
jgi:esterase/lipase superfamily enzyme